MSNFKTKFRLFYFTSILLTFVVVITVNKNMKTFKPNHVENVPEEIRNDIRYILKNSKCMILNLNPYNEEAMKIFKPAKYIPCRNNDLLTFVTKQNNSAFLHIRNDLIPIYSEYGVDCCYSNILRSSYNSDDDIEISECAFFKDSTKLEVDTVLVNCFDSLSMEKLYENTHNVVTIKEEIKIKMSQQQKSAISILVIGLDSISRLNFIRSMPLTRQFIEEKQFLPLKGYNKIADNTFPNIMAILTGFNITTVEKKCNSNAEGALDKCPLIWYDYRNFGHITAYAEDDPTIGTFNYGKTGFSKIPTDYYFRPYMMGSEKLKTVLIDRLTYCTGPETSAERILNAARDFSLTLKHSTTFGYFWMNTFSHNNLSMPSAFDEKVAEFFQDLSNNGEFNKSIVIFISDHGMRFGPIRNTFTGWLEERLPYIYFSFPQWFKEKFPIEYHNFIENENKLTTPYDLYMTLQHILVLSGYDYTIKSSDACPNCKSLFENIPEERSCEDAAIEQHYCTCYGYTSINLTEKVVTKVSNFLISKLNDIIEIDPFCVYYNMGKILYSSISDEEFENNFLLIRFETIPWAVFEVTLSFIGDLNDTQFEMSNDFSRLNEYYYVSQCVKDTHLKKYCYCNETIYD